MKRLSLLVVPLLALGGCATDSAQHVTAAGIVSPVNAEPEELGTLVVYTSTEPYYDGGIYYYPHRPYEIVASDGSVLRRVPNHRGKNDEQPTRLLIRPGAYRIRTGVSDGRAASIQVEIESGKLTRVDVERLLNETE